MTYRECLDYLYNRLPIFQRQGKSAYKADLNNTFALMKRLGNPERKFRSIHIAGTNGKGSSAHAISSILQSAGYRTGLYTSPHLKEFTERIRLDGREIEQESVIAFVEKIKPAIEEIKPSFFEVTVAMAFDYFVNAKVDIAVIETGMGGRLDSTNVIKPEVSLITNIGYDHMEFLGDTLSEIAAEKGGIIKSETPVVIGTHQDEVIGVFKKIARERQAKLIDFSESYMIKVQDRNELSIVVDVWKDGVLLYQGLGLDIGADYFLRNLPGVFETVNQLNEKGYKITNRAIYEGLLRVKELTGLKGRYQILGRNPLTIADVSHNSDGMTELMRQVKAPPRGKLRLIYGTVRDKNISKVLPLFPRETVFYFTEAGIPRSMKVSDLVKYAKEVGIVGSAYDNVNEALEIARKQSAKNDVILITGSTFVVAELNEL